MIQRQQGVIVELDKRFLNVRLDNRQLYKLPTWPTWIALGQRVRVTYDDANGDRTVEEIARD